MAILITSNKKRINHFFDGIEIESIYIKVEYKSFPDGKTIEVFIKTYLNKEDSLLEKYLYTDVPDNCFHVQIDTYEEQNLEYATLYAIKRFESLGYKCEILDD